MYDSMCVYKTLENANKSSVTTINWSSLGWELGGWDQKIRERLITKGTGKAF